MSAPALSMPCSSSRRQQPMMRTLTRARRVLLDRMWAPRPSVPQPTELVFLHDADDVGVARSRPTSAAFPFPPLGAAAQASWQRAEAAKETVVPREHDCRAMKDAVGARFAEWLLAFEGASLARDAVARGRCATASRGGGNGGGGGGHGATKSSGKALDPSAFAAFGTEVLDACESYALRSADAERAASAAAASEAAAAAAAADAAGSSEGCGDATEAAAAAAAGRVCGSVIEEPERGEHTAGDELLLAVSCALLERCAAHGGPMAALLGRLARNIAKMLHVAGGGGGVGGGEPSVVAAAGSSLSTCVAHHYAKTPYALANASLLWENHGLAEELTRAKEHMRLWSWAIWRNVVKGMSRTSHLLRGVGKATARKHRRAALRVAFDRWQAHNRMCRSERTEVQLRSRLQHYSDSFSLDQQVQDVIALFRGRESDIRSLTDALRRETTRVAQLEDELVEMKAKHRANEMRILEAVRRYTTSINHANEMAQENEALRSVAGKLKEEIASLRHTMRTKQPTRNTRYATDVQLGDGGGNDPGGGPLRRQSLVPLRPAPPSLPQPRAT